MEFRPMAKKMLIDSTHPEETRVGIVDENNRLTDYDFESTIKKTLKGNIYLAKIARVEPSLQAAFIDYGGDRHGFLAFNEIHPDYFRIPISDRQNAEKALAESILEQEQKKQDTPEDDSTLEEAQTSEVSTYGGELDVEEEMETNFDQNTPSLHRLYKIQEVIKKNQVILVQVTKEERGGKGAALTTYISMAGRYCVLMPNSPNSGGISRKIANTKDRKRLREILDTLNTPEGMGLIIRTAGMERSKVEIKRDAEYLMRTWNEIRKVTLDSIAPCLIYQEDEIIKRAIRDLYSKEVDEILVDGEEGYKVAKNFMKTLMPSHTKRVQLFKDEESPLFFKHRIEKQIDEMHMPVVRLPSGGSIVIHPTEALVSIDINSGRSTKERHIEETAFKTNMEAADEIYRQVRLRDLAGLIVIDFIDMDNAKNTANVEKRVRDIFRNDRARVQIGKISAFGLLEISRQRLKASLLETAFTPCAHCAATGFVRSVESTALMILRILEEEGYSKKAKRISIKLPRSVAFYMLNQKRTQIADIERRHQVHFDLDGDDTLHIPQYSVVRLELAPDALLEKEEGHHEPQRRHAGVQHQQVVHQTKEPAPHREPVTEERPAAAQPQPHHQQDPRPEGSTSSRRRRRRRGSNRNNPESQQNRITPESVQDQNVAEPAQVGSFEYIQNAQLQKRYDQILQTNAEKEANFMAKEHLIDPAAPRHHEPREPREPRQALDSNGQPIPGGGRNRRRRNRGRNRGRRPESQQDQNVALSSHGNDKQNFAQDNKAPQRENVPSQGARLSEAQKSEPVRDADHKAPPAPSAAQPAPEDKAKKAPARPRKPATPKAVGETTKVDAAPKKVTPKEVTPAALKKTRAPAKAKAEAASVDKANTAEKKPRTRKKAATKAESSE
jgi:ribonuclease E